MVDSFALITGASSGLGAEFARQLATQGHHVVLVARRKDVLNNLATELRSDTGVVVEVLGADLQDSTDLLKICSRLKDQQKPVSILVNNAGFGIGKSLGASPLQTHLDAIDLMLKAPVSLMHTALESMTQRGTGTIINVCSTAAFTTGGTYSATKRALLILSQSASIEYKNRGIQITAVNPGLTRSNFHTAMGVKAPRLPQIFWLSSQKVVSEALDAAAQGRAVCTPSFVYKALVATSRILPTYLVSQALGKTRNY